MKTLPLARSTILPRVVGIEGELADLYELAKLDEQDFMKSKSYQLVEYHLHRVLEGMINISNHIISRIPGAGGASHYKDIARALGASGIVSPAFVDKKLIPMFEYRNRVVHFYAEISPGEYYTIIHEHLIDVEEFLRAIKHLVEHPQDKGFLLE